MTWYDFYELPSALCLGTLVPRQKKIWLDIVESLYIWLVLLCVGTRPCCRTATSVMFPSEAFSSCLPSQPPSSSSKKSTGPITLVWWVCQSVSCVCYTCRINSYWKPWMNWCMLSTAGPFQLQLPFQGVPGWVSPFLSFLQCREQPPQVCFYITLPPSLLFSAHFSFLTSLLPLLPPHFLPCSLPFLLPPLFLAYFPTNQMYLVYLDECNHQKKCPKIYLFLLLWTVVYWRVYAILCMMLSVLSSFTPTTWRLLLTFALFLR